MAHRSGSHRAERWRRAYTLTLRGPRNLARIFSPWVHSFKSERKFIASLLCWWHFRLHTLSNSFTVWLLHGRRSPPWKPQTAPPALLRAPPPPGLTLPSPPPSEDWRKCWEKNWKVFLLAGIVKLFFSWTDSNLVICFSQNEFFTPVLLRDNWHASLYKLK